MMTTKVYSLNWDIGQHTGFRWHIAPTISEGIRYGMYAIQFFMGNPKSAWKRSPISDNDIQNSQILLSRFPMSVFSHYPYCANLAGQSSKDGLAWNENISVDDRLRGVMKALEYELYILSRLTNAKRSGVVIHPGSFPDRKKGHKTVSDTLNRINFPPNSVLLLENSAGEGNKLCRTLEEIRDVLEGVDDNKKNHVKVCIDTAHIFSQGDYDLRNCDEITRLFRDFERLIGIDKFYLLHLNDSRVPFAAKKDNHECLGMGYIWNHSFDSLIHLLNLCKKYNISIVLETPAYGNDLLILASIQPGSSQDFPIVL